MDVCPSENALQAPQAFGGLWRAWSGSGLEAFYTSILRRLLPLIKWNIRTLVGIFLLYTHYILEVPGLGFPVESLYAIVLPGTVPQCLTTLVMGGSGLSRPGGNLGLRV